MRIFSKFILTSLFFLTFLTLGAQDLALVSQEDILKAFINKNNVALKSVQKNSIKLTDAQSAQTVKDLLKLQLISVKLYDSNKDASSAAAFKVRQASLDFLSKNTAGSTDYFKITSEETTSIGSKAPLTSPNSYLSESELKSVDAIDTKNPSFFSTFTTTIQ